MLQNIFPNIIRVLERNTDHTKYKRKQISIYIYLAKYSKKKHNENLSSSIIFLPTLENIIILVTHVKNFEVVL